MSDEQHIIEPTGRTRVRRHPERAAYDRELIHSILDEALICHVAYVAGGEPRVIPTVHARIGDVLYLHGSRASRTIHALTSGLEVCVTATIVDALVLARSAFAHSMNYRSVIVYGSAEEVTDREEQHAAARALADHVAPGRGADARAPNDVEMSQTSLLSLAIEEASAKIRTGPPVDDPEDHDLPVWAGVLPLVVSAGDPEAAADLPEGTRTPDYLVAYERRRARG